MPRIEPELQRLQEIKTLPSLLKYLKEELNWPIGSEDVEEVTFDYHPAELGFDSASTAKIDEVRQLRPLTPGQKWGIFWVKFGKKQLPVQMLRRALGNLVVKKRATTKKSDKAAWHMHDLLFISAYGDDSNRHITFAHFSESEDSEESLPVLKVLGWDEDDTLLHLKDTYKTLLTTLNWETTPVDNPEAWREHWSSAFKLGHREVINTTKELVVQLAKLATVIKKSVLTSIKAETDKGPWKKLMLAFQKTLIKDLDEDQFADVIAQTVSYGLLTARLSSDGPISLKNLVDMVPATNPFLKELLQHFLTSAGMKGLFDVDEAGINDVVELLNLANAKAIRNDFGKKTDGEDPVIHFYEHFLGEYNKKLKVERGVFYTPQPVVSYIVRNVHELLKNKFGLEDGLADTSTWAEVQKKHKGLKIPEGIKDPKIEPFVQILDPATGTATFLIEVIDVIHNSMVTKWDRERISRGEQVKKWNTYVPTHLLPRLYAYELMMAPYAIAHMKVGLKLTETGFNAWDKITKEDRANIFLTNALEPWQRQLDLPGFDALAHEAASVNQVKQSKFFTVVLGNPPYSGVSWNTSEAAQKFVDRYRYVNGEPLGERRLWLQNDYVKFLGFAHQLILNAGVGCFSYITDSSYLTGPTFRGVRSNLLQDFSHLEILNLNGGTKTVNTSREAEDDQNVFDITQAVAAIHALRLPSQKKDEVHFGNLLGNRQLKYECLVKQKINWSKLTPAAPFFQFSETNADGEKEYNAFFSVKSAFPLMSVGIQTSRDDLAVGFSRQELADKIRDFVSPKATDEEIRARFFPGKKVGDYLAGDTRGWSLSRARKELIKVKSLDSDIASIHYRPFDFRYIYNSTLLVDWPRPEVSDQMKSGKNLGLCLLRRTENTRDYDYFSVSRDTISNHQASLKDGTYLLPLYVESATGRHDLFSSHHERSPNLSPVFLKQIADRLNVLQSGPHSLPAGLTPEDIFYYAYAVFNSATYRSRYEEFLKVDYPRLPLIGSIKGFLTLSRLGSELTALHLLESPKLTKATCFFAGERAKEIEKASWSDDTVWIDKSMTAGFKGVPEAAWNFHVGGYRVCEKWLKDRKGRKLTKDDIERYQKIVVALSETIRLMAEIDKVIGEHGGWPGAFQSNGKP